MVKVRSQLDQKNPIYSQVEVELFWRQGRGYGPGEYEGWTIKCFPMGSSGAFLRIDSFAKSVEVYAIGWPYLYVTTCYTQSIPFVTRLIEGYFNTDSEESLEEEFFKRPLTSRE